MENLDDLPAVPGGRCGDIDRAGGGGTELGTACQTQRHNLSSTLENVCAKQEAGSSAAAFGEGTLPQHSSMVSFQEDDDPTVYFASEFCLAGEGA
mmetsp:Transcript_96051/g.210183  ORF Transcript_96051/g.210183 Transcript_96051/m.210183 type:complete len:95 (-) Transcript_96051:4-288(-)